VTIICPLRFCNCVLCYNREFYEGYRCLRPVTLSSRLFRTGLSPSRIKEKRHRAFPLVTAGPITSPLMCFHKDQIVAYKLRSCRNRHNAPGVRLLRPNRGLHAASSGLHLRSCRDRRNAPGMRLLRPNQGLSRRIKRTSPSVMS
jgi:hypothetical protein